MQEKRPLRDFEDRLIGQAELLDLVSFSQTTLARLEKQGQFPARMRFGDRRVGWSFREVQKWIEEHKLNRTVAKE